MKHVSRTIINTLKLPAFEVDNINYCVAVLSFC